MRGFLWWLATGVILLAQGGIPASAQMLVWAENALIKVRPADAPKATPSAIEISAARNEYEPFQIVVRANGRSLHGVDVTVTDFSSGRGDRISCRANCTIYRELYIQIGNPSGPYGSAGEWPDALIPKVDRYAEEKRNAFPFDVAENRNQPIWIDVYVPPEATPGLYFAYVSVRAQGEPSIRIPVHLTVWAFTLPGTPSVRNGVGVDALAMSQQHGPSFAGENLDVLMRTYSKALLAHRLSNACLLGCGGWQPTPLIQPNTESLTKLQQDLGPFFDGSVLGTGAQITAVTPGNEMCLEGTMCRADVISFLASARWLDRLAFYLPDEPNLADSSVAEQVKSVADAIHDRDRRLHTFLTHSYVEYLQPQIDIWVVPLRELNQSFADGSYWTTYAREIELGKEVWVYQSCLSHICGVTSLYPGLEDWPDYMIDMQGMKNRIQDWVNWRFSVRGELYWCVNCLPNANADPYQDQFFYGGNGDGNLLYPGTPDRIGGKTHIPIESVRLKLKREGLEDYEYLVLLASHGARAFADSKAAELVRSATQWEHDPAVLYRVRSEFAHQLEILLRGEDRRIRNIGQN